MARRSAGLLLWRRAPSAEPDLEVLIGHMGGPFWARKDARAWSIPKGEYAADEDPFRAAVREFHEELGHDAPFPDPSGWHDLGEFRQSNKLIRVWAREGDLDAATCVSNTFEMEWPRGSGRTRTFPEVDRVAWTSPADARELLVAGQVAVVDALVYHLDAE